MNLKRLQRKLDACQYVIKANARVSFSQVGEDLIVNYLLQQLKISAPTYLDIGTNHPVIGNNTFFFYNRGQQGVCIEPDPDLFQTIKKTRKRDIVINAGVGVGEEREALLHIFPHPYTGWNTFSKEEAEHRQSETGIRIKKVLNLPLIDINSVFEKYFKPHPNFLSLDVEGLDLQVLKSIDFTRFRPEVICVESITFSVANTEEKISDIVRFTESQGYFVYADTHVNTIFCRTDLFGGKK